MTNIKDFPVILNPSDEDWILIQENQTIPAYKRTQLINIRGNISSSGGAVWSYRDGTVNFTIDSGSNFFIDTPNDVSINLEDIPEGTEIQLKRIRREKSLFLTGISKIEGSNVSPNSSIKVLFDDFPSKLIYINSTIGWFFVPRSSVKVLSPLSLPSTGLVQLFNVANIIAKSEDRIPVWEDEINTNNAIQTNINYQPQYIESIFADGTIGGLLFEGSQEYEVDLGYLANEKYTIAIVESRMSENQIYITGSTSGNTNSGLHIGYRGSTEFTLAQYGNDLDAFVPSYSNSFEPTLWIISNNIRGKEIFKNGDLIASNTNTDDLVEVSNGRIGSALGSFYRGYLGLLATFIGDKTTSELIELSEAINLTFGLY